MPIYDQGYLRWEGELLERPVRWWPIVREGLTRVVKQKKYLFLLVAAWLAPFARGVQLFLQRGASRLSDSIDLSALPRLQGLFADGPEFYYNVFLGQSLAVLVFLAMVGADLIARDRRHNALQIYFSKPLTVHDYMLGKLGILAVLIFFVTWLPILLLWLFALSLQLRADYFADVWAVPLFATAYTLLTTLVLGGLMLVLSSIGRRAVFVVVSFVVVIGFGPLQLITAMLKGLSGVEYWGLLRIAGALEQVGAWWFGANLPEDFHPAFSLVVLLGVIGACYAVLRQRIKPVEVVL